MTRTKDLVGQKFNKLTVIKLDIEKMEKQTDTKRKRAFWLCKCDCGNDNLISVEAYKLKSGHTKSCGCLKSEKAKERIIDLTGKTFGNLKVLKLDSERNKTSKDNYWICECQCKDKTIISVRVSYLTNGKTKSCGCLKSLAIKNRFKNIINIGDKFGKLTVISHDDIKYENYKKENSISRHFWICECECGNLTSVSTGVLNNGHTLSCGCLNSKNELILQNILNKHNINYIPQMKYDNLLGVGNGQLSYDFYLPKYNILIEYQGEFHDGNTRYNNINKDEFLEKLKVQQEHDKRKREYAKLHNINLLEIWYYEHKNDTELEKLLLNKIKKIKGEL